MDRDRYWHLLRRRWWLLALGLLLGAITGMAISRQTVPTYETSVKIVVSPVLIPGINPFQDVERVLKTYSELLTSKSVLQETVQRLGLSITAGSLGQRVGVSHTSDTFILTVSVEDTDRTRVVAIANTLAQVFIEQSQARNTASAAEARQQVEQERQRLRQQTDATSKRLAELRAAPPPGAPASDVSRAESELSHYQDLDFSLLETLQRMEVAQAQAASSLIIVEPAEAPTAPVRPLPLQTTVLAGLAGLLLTTGLVLAIEYFDDRVRDLDELRRRYRLTPLALLPAMGAPPPHDPELATLLQRLGDPLRRLLAPLTARLDGYGLRGLSEKLPRFPRHNGWSRTDLAAAGAPNQFTEAVRALRSNLEFVTATTPIVIAVTSAMRGEGKSTVAAHLALAEAQAGKRVLLIDADLRTPSLHHFFGLRNDFGLSDILMEGSIEPAIHLRTGPLGIEILTSGSTPPDPATLLDSRRMGALLRDLRQRADITIVDSAPILETADAVVLRHHVQGLLLVMDPSQTSRKTLRRALDRLPVASVMGVVLNRDTLLAGQGGPTDGVDGMPRPGEDTVGSRGRGRLSDEPAADSALARRSTLLPRPPM